MFATFKTRAEACHAEVHRVATRSLAVDLIAERLQKEGVADVADAWAVWADCPFLRGMDRASMAARVPGLRFEVRREVAARAKVGISQMEWAIASTGTLAQDATAAEQRMVSCLPWMHIALVSTERLVPDLPAFLTNLSPRNANYVALVTGPSRTADIERVLTIGVHGPEKLVVIFVDELGGAT